MNCLLAADHFLDQGSLQPSCPALLLEHLEGVGGDIFGYKETKRRQQDHQNSDDHIFGKHKNKGSDNRDNSRK